MSIKQRIIIGSRGSALARAQTEIVARKLHAKLPGLDIQKKFITTTGDRDQKSLLRDIGGKGIFIKELEQALLDGEIDIAVHSFKDVTSELAPGCTLAAFLAPESVSDVMITRYGVTLDDLKRGARIGTGSMRRKALLARIRPDLVTAEIRGNIDTRLAKVDSGEYDAIMLSEAGLIRLGLTDRISVRFDPSSFYPAPGQGVITIETRCNDVTSQTVAQQAGDASQELISTAELTLLTTVGFDCRTPLGVHTTTTKSTIAMCGFFITPDTGEFREGSITGSTDDPVGAGKALAKLLFSGSGAA